VAVGILLLPFREKPLYLLCQKFVPVLCL